jgi:hypothetical protein
MNETFRNERYRQRKLRRGNEKIVKKMKCVAGVKTRRTKQSWILIIFVIISKSEPCFDSLNFISESVL